MDINTLICEIETLLDDGRELWLCDLATEATDRGFSVVEFASIVSGLCELAEFDGQKFWRTAE